MTNPTPQPAAAQPALPLTPAEDKQWASFAHFGGVVGLLPSLVIYLLFKDRGALTRQEAKEALNWQITFTLAWIALWVVVGILSAIFVVIGASPVVGLLTWLPLLLYAASVVFSIMGGTRVNAGGSYRYPYAVRLIK